MPLGSSVGWFGCRRTESRPLETDGVAKARDDRHLAGNQDQILIAHELGDGCHHLRRKSGSEFGQGLGGCFLGEQPVAELTDGHASDRRERLGIVPVDDQPA